MRHLRHRRAHIHAQASVEVLGYVRAARVCLRSRGNHDINNAMERDVHALDRVHGGRARADDGADATTQARRADWRRRSSPRLLDDPDEERISTQVDPCGQAWDGDKAGVHDRGRAGCLTASTRWPPNDGTSDEKTGETVDVEMTAPRSRSSCCFAETAARECATPCSGCAFGSLTPRPSASAAASANKFVYDSPPAPPSRAPSSSTRSAAPQPRARAPPASTPPPPLRLVLWQAAVRDDAVLAATGVLVEADAFGSRAAAPPLAARERSSAVVLNCGDGDRRTKGRSGAELAALLFAARMRCVRDGAFVMFATRRWRHQLRLHRRFPRRRRRPRDH